MGGCATYKFRTWERGCLRSHVRNFYVAHPTWERGHPRRREIEKYAMKERISKCFVSG